LKAKEIIKNLGVATRENRCIAATYFIEHPNDFEILLNCVFKTKNKHHYKAAWILELVLKKHFDWLLPHLDFFTENLSRLQNDSAIRPIAKICEWIGKEYTAKSKNQIKNILTDKHISKIVENGFDWLIGNYKVASKAYTMNTLFIFGNLPNAQKWIHQELRNIIVEQIDNGSPAYKSRGKKVLYQLGIKMPDK
jgi:hypothetical protein